MYARQRQGTGYHTVFKVKPLQANQDSPVPQNNTTYWSALVREPLLHFLGAAALLFTLNAALSQDDRELIVVDSAAQQFLIEQQESLLLRPLAQEEQDALIENFIDDEILVLEARRRGLDDSSRIRRLLIQNMRFFYLRDATQPATDEQLRAFFDTHPELFVSPPTRTYQHVFYSDAEAIPDDVLERLNAGAPANEFGDGSALAQRRTLTMTTRETAASFGATIGPQVLAIRDEHWHGPLHSTHGIHFVQLLEESPGQTPTFDESRQWVKAQWELTTQRSILDKALVDMRRNYRIDVQPLETGAG